ncbi:MAG: MoaD/ThiS family protein [Spirochaetes bacterium]|nr:MoaD/ThiS family protein [Spirochaetota bacterium]
MLFVKGRKPADISVELKVVGFMAGEYTSIIGHVPVPDECSLGGLLKKARSSGTITAALYRLLASAPAGVSVLVNGEPLPPRRRGGVRLHGGDSVSFFSASTGG